MTTVYFDTSSFVRSHGKMPRGWGCWGFFIDRDPSPWFAPHSMPYVAAKKAAVREVNRRAFDAGIAFVRGAVHWVEVAP